MSFEIGDRLTHRHNPELGLGRVIAIEGRVLTVAFRAGTTLRLAADTDVLAPADFRPGRRVRLSTGEEASLAALLAGDRARLGDGREIPVDDLWPLNREGDLLERLAAGDVDPVDDFEIRLEALRLAGLREAQGLGSFLGGRIRLFPHQLHVASKATVGDPVRWLLADEVGLGKTVEACLVLNHLVRTRRVERCLIVAPDTLTVQWLGELWRKYHQVFVLLDEERLADVARDFGPDFNPFDAHRRVVVSLERLSASRRLVEQAVAAGVDLLVVDEAHRLRRPRGHPGNPAWRAVAPIAGLGRHLLLLSAIPVEDDAHGFFRLLQLLRPDELPDDEAVEARLSRPEPLPPCVSSTRRVDIGGLPPRVPVPVALDAAAWRGRFVLEEAVRGLPHTPAGRRAKADLIRRSLESGAALLAAGSETTALRGLAEAADAADPRLEWLLGQAPAWKAAGEKTLVFVGHRETLEWLRTALTHRAQLASALFHEDLSPARRDIEVARFRQAGGPSLLLSTECGGEGRNFEFCRRLVLFDLPWNPVVVEQRIGRLDRIGRKQPVEVVFFRPEGGVAGEAARLFEALGLFREPLAGLEPDLARVEAALDAAALGSGPVARFDNLVESADRARERIRRAAYRELHRDRYEARLAPEILARVPPGLDALHQEVVTRTAERLGLEVEERSGRRTVSIELGNTALVDSLPGVPGGASFLGTFDREAAVEDESLDFFASGHPLVEGLLAHLEESPIGRVTILDVGLGAERGFGLLALYKDGPTLEAVALDDRGQRRPDWVHVLLAPPLRTRRGAAAPPDWPARVRRLSGMLDPGRTPAALAALLVRPR